MHQISQINLEQKTGLKKMRIQTERITQIYISQIKFKTPMLKSIFCDYSDAYVRVSGTITLVLQVGKNPKTLM